MNRLRLPFAEFFSRSSTRLRSLPWLSRRRQGSLVVHLMLLAFLWGIAIYLFAIAGLWWTANRLIQDNLNRQALQWLGKLDELGTTLLISGDSSYFEPIRKHVSSFPEVAHLTYYAADGKTILASYTAPGRDTKGFSPPNAEELAFLSTSQQEKRQLIRNLPELSVLRVTGPALIKSVPNDGMLEVSIDGNLRETTRLIGYIDLGLDFHIYRETLGRNILYGSGLILLLFLAATLVGRLIILRALRPLAELQVPLARLAQGDTDIEVTSEGATTEIAAIGQALNTTIAALRERDRELKHLAVFDTLTGLFNRYSFNHALEREKARILLDGHCSALLFIDLDRFKEVNDSVGHAAGDELLIQVAQRFKNTVRANDIVSRLGGDEFTIILKDTHEEDALRVAEQICASLREFVFTAEGQSFRVQCSIGITLIDSRQVPPSVLLSQADTACHEAKTQGRNTYVLFREIDPHDTLHLQQTGIRELLETALAQQGFSLVFLPVVDSQSGLIHHFDSAVRIINGTSEIPASAFISAAERFDLIQRIDRQVITMALEHLTGITDRSMHLSIKISGRTLQQSDILTFIGDSFTATGVEAQRITFEISERAILESVSQVKNFMEGLREMGCGIAIDDFGVSLNALSLLERLPIQQLRIEGNLVNSICSSSFNHALLSSFVSIARELGVQTVAKQVFREEEARELRRIGIDLLQGSILGHPRHSLHEAATATAEEA